MKRLSRKTLKDLPSGVQTPAYDPASTQSGIVHLGVGAFHRAHQAVVLDDLLARDPQWAIEGASLRRSDMRDALLPQDFLYTLAIRSDEETRLRVIGSLRAIHVVPDDPDKLLRIMDDPLIRIASLTVTEKGYCHHPSSGNLDPDHPDIQADLASPRQPVSAPGILVEALRRRRKAGVPPFTVMPCDNLPANGPTVHRVLVQYAALFDDDLARFIESDVAVAGTMVDRIVPATSEEDIAGISRMLGVEDKWPVTSEPFSQWVIEDRFPTGRPQFESAGVQMVEDVEPFETMKLRMLNGSHSTLAYLGYLAGYRTIADAMENADFKSLIGAMMSEEIIPGIAVEGVDLAAYRDDLLARFSNRALQHRTWQIAMDGSQKLPQRLLGSIRDRLDAGQPFDRLALGVAAWMRYATGHDEQSKPIDVRDPMRDRLRDIADQAGRDPSKLAGAYFQLNEIFGPDLPDIEAFTSSVSNALAGLFEKGAVQTVKEFVRRTTE